MNKERNPEEKLDFDISSIFGDFTQEIPGLKIENLQTEEEEKEEPTEDKEQETKSKNEKQPKVPELETDDEEDSEDSKEEEAETKSSTKKSTEAETDEDEDVEIEYSYKALASYLAEQGIIDFEDSEDLEDNPEVLEQAVIKTAKNMVEEYKDSIPTEGKLFLDYLEKGGDPAKYLQTLEKPIDFEDFDLDDEVNQKRVLKEFLQTQGYTSEEIDDEIKDYEDALILAKKAKTAATKLKGIYEKQKEELIKQQEEELKERQKQVDNYIKEIKSTIQSSDNLAGLSLSAADKKEFEKYLLARDKQGLTQYEKELQENPIKTQLELAYLKYKKFDFSKIANKVKTEETKRIKNLIKTKETTVKGKSKQMDKPEKSDLSAFRNIF